MFPDYGRGWKCKITLPSILESERLNVFQLTVLDPAGERERRRACRSAAYLQLVAATNFKQRMRKMIGVLPRRSASTTRSRARPTGSSTTRASS